NSGRRSPDRAASASHRARSRSRCGRGSSAESLRRPASNRATPPQIAGWFPQTPGCRGTSDRRPDAARSLRRADGSPRRDHAAARLRPVNGPAPCGRPPTTNRGRPSRLINKGHPRSECRGRGNSSLACSGRRIAQPLLPAPVLRPLGGIFGGIRPIIAELLGVQPLQERPAPAAAGAGAVAFAQLARHRGPPGANELLDLAAGDVETETELVVSL